MSMTTKYVNALIKQWPFVLFTKAYSPQGKAALDILHRFEVLRDVMHVVEIEKRGDCDMVETHLLLLSGRNRREVPLLFANHVCIGGYKEILRMYRERALGAFISRTLHPPPPEPNFNTPGIRCINAHVEPVQAVNTGYTVRIRECSQTEDEKRREKDMQEEKELRLKLRKNESSRIKKIIKRHSATSKLSMAEKHLQNCDVVAKIEELTSKTKDDRGQFKVLGLRALRLNYKRENMLEVRCVEITSKTPDDDDDDDVGDDAKACNEGMKWVRSATTD